MEAVRYISCAPVKPNSPNTVMRCAWSKKLLDPTTHRSNSETFALFAASCAARNRLMRCSGVSPAGPGLLLPMGGPRPPDPEVLGDANREFGLAAAFDEGCGVLAVKRVASDTLLGFAVIAIASDIAQVGQSEQTSGTTIGSCTTCRGHAKFCQHFARRCLQILQHLQAVHRPPPTPISSPLPLPNFVWFSSFLLHTYLDLKSDDQEILASGWETCIAQRGVNHSNLSFGAD
jgi:hypothetical protein